MLLPCCLVLQRLLGKKAFLRCALASAYLLHCWHGAAA